MARGSTTQQKARRVAGPDADEQAGVEAAAATLSQFARVQNPEAVVTAVISAWIIERTKRHTGGRISDMVVFDLGNSQIAGMIEASLPKIGDALAGAGYDFGKAFADLSRGEAVQLFTAGVCAYRDAAVCAGEAPGFPFSEPFSDPIPFGDAPTKETPPWE